MGLVRIDGVASTQLPRLRDRGDTGIEWTGVVSVTVTVFESAADDDRQENDDRHGVEGKDQRLGI